MATKVSGIKGINISKASVLNDGSKKTSGNESFRDTSNGTTRDNSGNSALDAASLKLLLGQTELLAKKAQEIEQNMKIARQKEEDRQRQLEERRAEKEKKDQEKERNDKKRQESEDKRTFDSYYNNINKGIINGGLAQLFGPAGVLLGKGLNTLGLPIERMGKWALRKSTFGLARSIGSLWGGDKDADENALSVNRREEAAAPVNNLKTSVVKRLDKIIAILGGKKFSGGEGQKSKSLLDRLKSLFEWLKNGWLGKLFSWLGPKLAYIGGLAAMGYGLHKLWQWAKEKFGTHAADDIVAGTSQGLKATLQGMGNGIQKMANSMKALKKGAISSKPIGAVSRTLGKMANSGKVGNALFGGAAKSTRAASIAAQRSLQAGELGRTGKSLLGAGKTLSKVGRAAGVVGNLVIAGEAGYDAYNKFQAGDNRGGYGAIGRGTGAIAGGSLGMWGGAAAGAAIGSVVPVIGTAIGGLIGGILGAVGGGWLGSKGGEALGEYGYDLATGNTNRAASEGSLITETPSYSSMAAQNEQLEMQREMLNSLKQIELNLNPEIQKDLDNAYIDNIKREFDRPPEVNTNYFNDYTSLNSAWKDSMLNNMENE